MNQDSGGAGRRYLACPADGSAPRPFTPPDVDAIPNPDARYFARALAAMEPQLAARGLTFYLTWNTRELPSYGPDVVAVVVGDEAARIPAYFHRVAITFKGYGTRPTLGVRPGAWLSRLGLAAILELVEKLMIDTPGAINFAVQAIRARAVRPPRLPGVFPVPLGYFQQLDRQVIPILDRPVDVFFAGSIRHFLGGEAPLARRLVPSAKLLAREQMLRALEVAKVRMPDLRVDLALSGGFGDPDALSAEQYSERLMATRICLAPRGNTPDTLRIFEGLRYGCVVVCDPVPRRQWFYRDAPLVVVPRWQRLPEILADLLADAEGLAQRHEAALTWWRQRGGEAATGAYMAEQINRYVRPVG